MTLDTLKITQFKLRLESSLPFWQYRHYDDCITELQNFGNSYNGNWQLPDDCIILPNYLSLQYIIEVFNSLLGKTPDNTKNKDGSYFFEFN